VGRAGAVAAALAVALLALAGAGGAAPQQTPKRGGTVVVWAPVEPACLNWLLSCGNSAAASAILDEVLEGAFAIGPRHYVPALVSPRVDVRRQKPFTVTFHIREAARWSDGVPVTAADFTFTQAVIRSDVPPDTEIPQLRYQRTAVRAVRALDAKTVRVVLTTRSAGWRDVFAVLLPRHALSKTDVTKIWQDRIDDPRTGAPIGSGPFLVGSWQRGRQLTLVRNPRYSGRHRAYLDRIVLRFNIPLADVPDALRAGEVDVVQRRPDPETEPQFRQAGERQIYGPGRAFEHFDIRVGSGGHPALQNKLVRRALAYGLDRAATVSAVYGGYLPNWKPSQSAVLLGASRYYEPNWSVYRYRPALARRLLAQAGCRRDADGIFVCGGERLSLRFVTTVGGNRRRIALELAQRQLRRVGIEVTPTYVVGSALFGQALPSGDYDVALFTWFYPPDVGGASDIYRCGGPENFTGYCQRIVTRDLDQADRILDPAQRARVLNRADRQMAKDVPVIPLWNEPAAATVRANVQGVVACFPSLIWGSENWWLDR
jgi:peptide/nickel transport system substrate-binding protein